jgi:hypothetical protein
MFLIASPRPPPEPDAMEFPTASCLKGTFLTPIAAKLSAAGSVAHGH